MDPAQRSLSEVHVMFCECYLFIFYARLMLRPRLTEVRETFTRDRPWVWIEKLQNDFTFSLFGLSQSEFRTAALRTSGLQVHISTDNCLTSSSVMLQLASFYLSLRFHSILFRRTLVENWV